MLRSPLMLWRLLGIARTLARHDALAAVEKTGLAPTLTALLRRLIPRRRAGRPGQNLARAFVELGPSFIKLGQFLATRADLIGEEMARDLAELQDRLPPFPSAEARRVIAAELGAPVEALFTRFEEAPVSAASIAQVHFAVTRPQGPAPEAGPDAVAEAPREVAVKVLRPGVEEKLERDLRLLYWLARLAERTEPRLRRFRPVALVAEFERVVKTEMDLRLEAAGADELAENFAGDESYRVPAVDWERTARRVLTMERIAGIRMDDREALLAAGHDLPEVLEKAAAIFFRQVFRDGFFHGDQHPGNMFVDAEGNIVAVDFGIMGRLSQDTRALLADMLLATLRRDYRRLAAVQAQAGFLPPDQPRELYAQSLRAVCEPIFGQPLERISFARLLGQLLQLTESYQMPVQPELVLLQKNMLMAEGISRRLDPDLNIWLLAEPLIAEWVRENRGPAARAGRGAEEVAATLARLPELARRAEDLLVRLSEERAPETAGWLGRPLGPAVWLAGLALAVALLALLD
ncbi:2-octaprenylphenol hydroxylase [Phormidium willei BDU 130791]|nr:2-octaprenylphenol hydroxylase [Phormidium willei BDU 130791]